MRLFRRLKKPQPTIEPLLVNPTTPASTTTLVASQLPFYAEQKRIQIPVILADDSNDSTQSEVPPTLSNPVIPGSAYGTLGVSDDDYHKIALGVLVNKLRSQ